jgi:hypothetical protein
MSLPSRIEWLCLLESPESNLINFYAGQSNYKIKHYQSATTVLAALEHDLSRTVPLDRVRDRLTINIDRQSTKLIGPVGTSVLDDSLSQRDTVNASGDIPSTFAGASLRGQGASLREESPSL